MFVEISLCESDRIDLFDITEPKKFPITHSQVGGCLHLHDDNTCAIYEDRPQICKRFKCEVLMAYQTTNMSIDTALNILEEKFPRG